jgi:biopolymer transport protein ExbD
MAAQVAGSGETPMSDINTTPLVDVMLVLLIIFLIAVPIAIQTIEKMKIPIIVSQESKDKAENMLVSVSTTDAAGISPGEPGYEGPTRNGECRIYMNNVTAMNSDEFRTHAGKRLEAIIKREGGIETLLKDPEKVPQVHIRADVNTPWRCVAGVIYNSQIQGYPTVGFLSNPVNPDGS